MAGRSACIGVWCRGLDRGDWLDTWKRLDHAPAGDEVIRNLPVRHPLIWFDDIMTQAATQTKVLLDSIQQAKRMAEATAQTDGAFSPRTIGNGQLKLVTSRDWTSGFFPGELWMLYEYTHKKEWKDSAVRYTALMQREMTNATTHDMGFKMNCSFGNGYRITHDSAYRTVLISRRRTLSTRLTQR